ncbi:flagellar assembly protein FliH [Salipaludibacillus keqinensis]|uniref:flagellar assembly protein FliH n=1 Tax=Salipaludibacillus keqinensis TaxID=2045207 RepID=UPI0013049D22|nr:flagellar assembly protein FliH [Salipaludibacillus keqinensis]
MSKLIKSTLTKQSTSGEKKIQLRTVHALHRTEFSHEEPDRSEQRTQSGNNIHYKDQIQTLQQEREALDQLKESFQHEVNQWKADQKNQKQQLAEEADVRLNQAAEAGFNQGYEEGIEQGIKQYSEMINQAHVTVTRSKLDYHDKLNDSQSVMLDLAFAVAEKIIGQTFQQDDQAWLSLVKQAVTEVREQEEVKIYVHPTWYETTLKHKKELQGIALHTRELLVFPDESLNKYDCFIETPYGQVNASVDSQLRELKRVLVEKLKEGTSNEYS